MYNESLINCILAYKTINCLKIGNPQFLQSCTDLSVLRKKEPIFNRKLALFFWILIALAP